MPFWAKRSKNRDAESPERTLARLQSETGKPRYPLTVTKALRDGQLRLQRGGYNITEVDQFLATIDERTVDEINDVVFSIGRRIEGYSEDQVDALLDKIVSQRADGD